MGDAQRFQAQIEQWVQTLSGPEKVIFNVCRAAFDEIIINFGMTEGCYHISFFLTEYLRFRHSIAVNPVVGYVKDGEDDVMISHAWIEYQGKKSDLTLVNAPPQPKAQALATEKAWFSAHGR